MKLLKLFWEQRKDGVYGIAGMHSCDLVGPKQNGADFFAVCNDIVVLNGGPPIGGTIQSVLGESIVPVVANVRGEHTLRCVGTGFFVSCTGLLITAAHVITDPIERRYGNVAEQPDLTLQGRDLNFGVLVPNNPIFEVPGYSFFHFHWSLFLAERRDNPLPIAGLDLKLTSDIAICKVPPRRGNTPHQPLTIVQSGIRGTGARIGSVANAVGYAGMADFEIEMNEFGQILGHRKFILHGSRGTIIEQFPDNLQEKAVPTPGPCFSFGAKIPGGMSGGPIFDREGIYVHGVISKGWEDETGPTNFSFGSSLLPSMHLPISRMNGVTLSDLQEKRNEGMGVVRAPDL